MHIHYFQHDHFEDLGYIGDWAANHNFTTSVTRFDLNQELPLLSEFDWLIVLGGKMSVNDSDKYPWITKEIEFIRKSIDSGKIVIGICLGSQLLAKALGARVYKNNEPEMGFWPVKFSDQASNDKVFRYFPSELDVLHVHFDTFTLPDGAINMANSIVTPCQAFRWGKNVFAFQFHFEVTPANVGRFVREVTPELIEGKYSQKPDEINSLSGCCRRNNNIFEKVINEIYSINK